VLRILAVNQLQPKNQEQSSIPFRNAPLTMQTGSSALMSEVLDCSTMSKNFNHFFRQEYPTLELQVKNCRIGAIYQKPGKSCRVTYFLEVQDKCGETYENWFHATVSSNGLGLQKREKHYAHPGCGFWKPVMLWPEMNMVLHAFPYDPQMPYLGQLIEPDFVRQAIQENMTGFGLTDDWRCEKIMCSRVKHRPGKSCTLLHEAEMIDRLGSTRYFKFFGKTYRTPVSRHIFDVVQQIFECASLEGGALNIPKPIAHIDAVNTVWQHAWEGQNLSYIGKTCQWKILVDSNVVKKVAAMVAQFHEIRITNCPLRRGASVETVLQNAAEDCAKIARFLPDKTHELRQIMDQIAACAATQNEEIPQKTIHGTFKLAQILCHQERLALVDFDSVALGDPLYDVAEFLASLEFLKVTDAVDPLMINRSISMFLSCYQDRVSWSCDHSRIAFYAIPFLLGKIHSSLKKMESAAADEMSIAMGLLEKWTGQL